MRLFHRSAPTGFQWTAIAAGLLVLVSVLSNPLSQLFRIGRGSSHGVALVGALVMAAALLDRWRPMRVVVRLTALGAAVGWIVGAVYGRFFPVGGVLVGGAWATIFVILGLRPVRDWFRRPKNEWGSEGEEALAAMPAGAMLPPETLDDRAGAAPQREVAGSELRAARSNRAPGESK